MTEQADEQVLVVPTEVFHRAGVFQGFRAGAEAYLGQLLDPRHLLYLPRSRAETDPSYKQLIPYVVLRWRDRVFCYRRGRSGTEARLRARLSLGVGGHICSRDGAVSGDAYRTGLAREMAEEIYLESAYEEHGLGLINDDSTPVGQVHLGIVHRFDLAEPNVRPRDPALADGGFAPLADLRRRREEFETWSQFLLDAPCLG